MKHLKKSFVGLNPYKIKFDNLNVKAPFDGYINKFYFDEGQKILAGQELGRIGKESDSGGWFCHLHLQIITQKAMNEGYSEWGYISEELLSKVEEYFPNPNFLFKR